MPIPAGRIDDKIHATKFRAKAGLTISFEPNYCPIGIDYLDVDFSPVPILDFGNLRVCEDVDVAWDATSSYSPFDTLVGPPPVGTTWLIDWGDGNTSSGNNIATASGNYGAAANEWDLDAADAPEDGVYTITFTLTDDSGLQTIIERQIQVIKCIVPFMALAFFDGDGIYSSESPFTIKNSGLDGAWLNVNDALVIQNGPLVETWIATDAGIAYSQNGGASWNLQSLPTPPNNWGDTPAPSIAGLTFIALACDDTSDFTLYALARYWNGTEYRAWLYYRPNGQSWQVIALGGHAQPLVIGSWAYPETVLDRFCWRQANPTPPPDGTPDVTYQDLDNLKAVNLQYAQIEADFPQPINNLEGSFWLFIFDLGGYISVGLGALIGGINVEARLGDFTDAEYSGGAPWFDSVTMRARTMTRGPDVDDCQLYTSGTELVNCLSGGAYPDGCDFTTVSNAAAATMFRYVGVAVHPTAGGPGHNWPDFWRYQFDYFRFWPVAVDTNCRPIGLAAWGGVVYLTTLEGGQLRLVALDAANDYEVLRVVALGSATDAQINARTRWAKPYILNTPGGERTGRLYLYGSIITSPDGGGASQLLYSDDVGQSWTDVQTAWAGYVGAIAFDPLNVKKVYAVQNNAGGTLQVSDDDGATWTGNALPFESEALAISPDWLFELAVGNRTAAANPVYYTMSDGVSFFVTSAGLPALPSGGITRLVVLSEY